VITRDVSFHHLSVWRRIANRANRAELLLMVLAAPLLLFPNRWTPLALILILLTWLGRRLALGRLTHRTPLDVPVLVLLIMTFVGYVVSADPALSRAKLWGIILGVAVFYALLNGLPDRPSIMLMARLAVAGTVVLALVALVGTDWSAVRLVDLSPLYDRIPTLIRGLPGSGVAPTQELFHPRQVGATMAMLLPLAVVWPIVRQNRLDRLLAAGAILTAGLVLLLSQAVMGYFGLLMALLLIAVWWRRWLIWPILAGFLALIILLILNARQLAELALTQDDPLGIGFVLRFDIWSRALAMIRDMPFTGVGLNTFPLVQTNFYIGYLLGPEVHAHNLFLQTAVDLGLPGLFALLGVLAGFAVMVITACRATNSRPLQALLVGTTGCVLAFVAGGLLDTMTLGAKPVAALWAIMGLAAAVAILPTPTAGFLPDVREESASNTPFWNITTKNWLFAIPLLLFLLAILSFPAARQTNLALITAHRAIHQTRTEGRMPDVREESAISHLEQAIALDPENPELFGALGTLYAWHGNHDEAVKAFRRRVALDSRDPYGLYAPFESWRRQLNRDPVPESASDLIRVYSRWRNRYPDRAEGYVLTALVYQDQNGDVEKTAGQLQLGLEKEAAPPGLLTALLNQFELARQPIEKTSDDHK
jgi:putative inorganic carbon (HCO3(-)) transporter